MSKTGVRLANRERLANIHAKAIEDLLAPSTRHDAGVAPVENELLLTEETRRSLYEWRLRNAQ